MTNNVKDAVYYYYEGETLLITKENQGGDEDCISIEVYRSTGSKDDGISAFISMAVSDWELLVRKVNFKLLGGTIE